ncbi:MAG: hypothetical protein RPT00_08870 [Gammaproteobacteria bacterium]
MSKKNCRASSKHRKALKRKYKLAKRNKKSSKKSKNALMNQNRSAPLTNVIAAPDSTKLEDAFSVLLLDYCPIKTSLVFSSLILKADCHSMASSLESAIRLCLSFCKGKAAPDKELILSVFIALDELGITLMNDPAEDVLISTLWFNGSPYKVLTGLWDGAIYQAQNLIDIVENNDDIYSEIGDVIHNVLQASNLVISKTNLNESELGGMSTHEAISDELLEEVFNSNYCDGLFVGSNEILPILEQSSFPQIHLQPFGACDLEEKPFYSYEGNQYLLLPNIIPLCLKRIILRKLMVSKTKDFIDGEYSRAISNNLSRLKLFGKFSGQKIPSPSIERIDECWYASQFSVEFDKGYIFHFVFIIQSTGALDDTWFSKTVDTGENVSRCIDQSIIQAKSCFLDKFGAQKGCTIIIPCSLGSQLSIEMDFSPDEKWMVEVIPIHDLALISKDYSSSPRRIWRFIESVNKLKLMGVTILNMSGFLNLYSFAKQNNYEIIQHSFFNESNLAPPQIVVHIPNNAIAEIKQLVLNENKTLILDYHGQKKLKVRRGFTDSFFKHNERYNIYVPIVVEQDLFQCAYVNVGHKIWITQKIEREGDYSLQFQCYNAALSWIERILNAVQEHGLAFPENLLEWRLHFSSPNDYNIQPLPDIEDVLNSFSNTFESSILTSSFNLDFFRGLRYEFNYSERAIVLSLVKYICDFNSNNQYSEILNKVVPDNDARHIHLFVANSYSEFFSLDEEEPIYVDETDANNIKLGMGWLCRNHEDGNELKGKEACKKYISSLISALWKKQKGHLEKLDRKSLLICLLKNITLSQHQSIRWKRTFKANSSLQPDPAELSSVVNKQLFSLNGSSLFSRLVIEMAICESAPTGGRQAGVLEIQELLCHASTMHHMGGLSDSINLDCVKPKIVISALGDVMSDRSFPEQVIESYASSMIASSLEAHSKSYSEHLYEHEPIENATDVIQAGFCDAWEEEFGASIDSYRGLIDELENIGISKDELVYISSIREIMSKMSGHDELISRMISELTIYPRNEWTSIPAPFKPSDWQPWRFRRRFSLMLRPIIQLDENCLIIAPTLVRLAFAHLVDLCYSGSLDGSRFFSSKMKKWIGRKNNDAGLGFNSQVAEKLEALGWVVKKEKELTDILKKPLDKDYGDVDVFAWNHETGEVAIIECKSLDVAKTPGEVSRQLSEFRGKINNKGKNDLLLKHQRRYSVLQNEIEGVSAYTKIETNDLKMMAYIVFSNIVPMVFDSSRAHQNEIRFITFDDLSTNF